MPEHTFDNALRLLESRINLEQLRTFEAADMEGKLDTLRQILDTFGEPETKYRTVHVAGTKGKGSTCILLESILLEEGKQVGTFISPHHYSVTERIRINGKPCSEEDFTELIFSVCEKIDPETLATLTFFELLTLLALVYFAEQKVDVAIFEVGLGGRLDATNVCRPNVTAISSISYDHIMQLGPTLSEIALEKCGIIKQEVPVVSTVLHPDAQAVVRLKSQEKKVPAYFLGEAFFVKHSTDVQSEAGAFRFQAESALFPVEFEVDNVVLSMPGSHQVRNAALAVAARLLLFPHSDRCDETQMRNALKKAYLPLRVEVVREKNKPVVVFDGAHNRSSVRAFVQTVCGLFPGRRLFLIFGTTLEKDVEGMVAELSGRFEHIYLTQYSNNPRYFPATALKYIFALDPGKLSPEDEGDEETGLMKPSVLLNPLINDAVLKSSTDFSDKLACLEVAEKCTDALQRCLQRADSEDVICCVTGSLYLAAELRKHFFREKE